MIKRGGIAVTKIQPKKLNKKPVNWEMSELSRNIVKHFAQYSDRTEEEIIGLLIKELLEDEDFVEWASKKKNNKRLLNELGLL
jgi:hypothetical protein